MDCIIIEDNKLQRKAITELISRFPFLNLIGEFENPVDAYDFVKKNKIDLLFLDVEMPEMTGLEFLKNLESAPMSILITSNPDYALEAFEYYVMDYLVKPVRPERFLKAIEKARTCFENTLMPEVDPGFIFIREDSMLKKIKTDEIIYVQALGDYVTIYLTKKKHVVHATLASMEDKLKEENFMRVHRSYIVSLNKIDTLEGSTAYVAGKPVPVGDTYKAELMKKINLV